MALINCPECGKEISDKAVTCPHCDFGLNAAPTRKKSNAIPIFLLIVFVVAGCICLYKANENNTEMEVTKTVLNLDPSSSKYNRKMDDYKKNKLIFSIISGSCMLASCICVLVIVNNNKQNGK